MRVEGVATEKSLKARVVRWSRTPALAGLLEGGRVRVLDEEVRFGASEGRVASIVRFAVRSETGGPRRPALLDLRGLCRRAGRPHPGGEKYFVIED